MINVLLTQFASETAEESSGFAALGFDPKAFLIQLITFLFVFYILKRYVFGRVVDLLEKRRMTIEDGVRLTTEIREQKEKLDKEVEKIQKDARKHADEVISEAQAQSGVILKEAEESAQAKIEILLTEAGKKIEQETQRARAAVEKEAVELVIKATEVIAREKIDTKKDQSLIANALKEQA